MNLTIGMGEFLLVCGASGCGKTTMLRLLKRELAPAGNQKGRIYYQGIANNELAPEVAATKIGYVLQNPAQQIVTDKVWHELAFGLENMGLPTDVIRRKVGEMAHFFGIHPWFHKTTEELSGGQKQLLNLASIMVMQPEVLILDEPTAQLDPIAAAEFIATLQKINKEMGTTIIIVEHRLEEVYPIADRVAVLEKGELLICDTPKRVASHLQNVNVAHPIKVGLPSAVRIYQQLHIETDCPLTVRDGRQFLMQNYGNQIRSIEEEIQAEVAESSSYAVELKNVWFRYGREQADILTGLNLKVKQGTVLSILGGNGSGKTTLLKVISGQMKAYQGSIKVHNKKLKEYRGASLYKNMLAVLPQDPQTVFVKTTVREEYLELCRVMEYSKSDMEMKIYEVVSMLGIPELLDQHPYDLSGGEQQKAALGKLLMLQPKVVLLDEPTKGLDGMSKEVLQGVIQGLKKQGITVILVTHDIEFAAVCSDECCLFFDGDIISKDTPRAFFSTNSFYTTAASRISRHQYDGAITCEDVVMLCNMNRECRR